MEKVEIAIRMLSIAYALGILIIILCMQGQDTSTLSVGLFRSQPHANPECVVSSHQTTSCS